MSIKRISEPLQTMRMPNGKRRLDRALVYEIDGEIITVPAGFVTDYSSIPSMFSWLVRWDRVDCAGVVHDWLYQSGTMPRRKADKIWRKVAQYGKHSANPAQAWTGWAGLRLGGWVAWIKHRKNNE